MASCLVLLTAFIGSLITGTQTLPLVPISHELPQDAILPARPAMIAVAASAREDFFKYLWLASDGSVYNESETGRLEIAATPAITDNEHQTGTYIVKLMTRNMPSEVWDTLASKASVGFFTKDDKTTAFPEYAYLKDSPECKGMCNGTCSGTCTSDGRKFESLAGVGGIRATCINDNFMCTDADPYWHQFSVLVHEFGHTIHLLGLPGASEYHDKIRKAYQNARTNETWDLGSYAMSNELEYFAEATGVFFNAERLKTSTGGMNSCGHTDKMCADETEARDWLAKKDPQLFDALSYTYTNHRPTLPGGLEVCVDHDL